MNAVPARSRRRGIRPLLLLVGVVIVAGLAWRASLALRIASASVSTALCAGTFVSGLDPDQVYREEQRPLGGMSSIAWALRYAVDRERKEVVTTIAGGFVTRAVYRDGYGCHRLPDDPGAFAAAEPMGTAAAVAIPPLAEAIDPRLSPALDEAFKEPDARGLRQTKAIVVLHEGKLVAERYAPGYTVDTPIWGHSLTKSVTSALIGILVRDGKLTTAQRAPVKAWQKAGDPRRDVTVDQLLRMDAGLPFDETNAIVTPATRMWFLSSDSAAFASRQALVAKPGAQWGYSNLSYGLLSGLIRDAAGGGGAAVTRRFIERELFEPVGMQHATLDFDPSGTPLGSGFMYAPARSWARFGQLYLDDGMADGRRILPAGWAEYSAAQSLDSSGYGAGFWTNWKKDGEIPYWGIEWGLSSLPPDTYFGRGFLGQFIVIVPSARLVVVRMGLSHDTSPGVNRLVASILDTLKQPAGPLP